MLYFFIAMFLTMSSLFFKHKLIWILSGCIFFMMYFQVFMVSIMGAAIYYRPENWYIYIIFVLGLLLIIAEVYIPGFGIVGLIGASLSTYSLYVFEGQIDSVFLYWIASLGLLGCIIWIYSKLGRHIEISPQFILENDIEGKSSLTSNPETLPSIGETGVVVMDLRPVGRCRFGELEVQSISTGSYIKMDSLVRVESIRNGNIYVEEEIVNE